MRGEVLTLSSNVMVTSDTSELSMTPLYPEPWPGHILVSDYFESDFTYRTGSIELDNVSIYNCSKPGSDFAAIKFDNARMGIKKVTNSVMFEGQGKGVVIKGSSKIELRNNIIHSFVNKGIISQPWVGGKIILTCASITIDGNIVNNIRSSMD